MAFISINNAIVSIALDEVVISFRKICNSKDLTYN